MENKGRLINSFFYKPDKPIGRVEFLLYIVCFAIIKLVVLYIYTLFHKYSGLFFVFLGENLFSLVMLVLLFYLEFITYMKRFWSITLNKKDALIYTSVLFGLLLLSGLLKPLKYIVGLVGLVLLIIAPKTGNEEVSTEKEDV